MDVADLVRASSGHQDRLPHLLLKRPRLHACSSVVPEPTHYAHVPEGSPTNASPGAGQERETMKS